MLRGDDQAQLCELHPDEARALRELFRDDARVHVHQHGGYAAMKALLPPAQRRGLVLIDPPYEEQAGEFARIQAALDAALGRWPNGVYAVWYPIKLGRDLQPFRRWLGRCAATTVLDVELLVRPDSVPQRLNGAGVAILNPPWRLDERLDALMPLLAQHLAAPGRDRPRPHALAQDRGRRNALKPLAVQSTLAKLWATRSHPGTAIMKPIVRTTFVALAALALAGLLSACAPAPCTRSPPARPRSHAGPGGPHAGAVPGPHGGLGRHRRAGDQLRRPQRDRGPVLSAGQLAAPGDRPQQQPGTLPRGAAGLRRAPELPARRADHRAGHDRRHDAGKVGEAPYVLRA